MDEYFMGQALEEAKKAYSQGEVPIGAIVVYEGRIIARGYNKKEKSKNPLAHGEIEAIDQASKSLGRWRLSGCSMYVSLEPCSMCAGAILNSRLDRLVIGALDPRWGACGSKINLLDPDLSNHRMEISHGILGEECGQLLSNFFMDLRQGKIDNK